MNNFIPGLKTNFQRQK